MPHVDEGQLHALLDHALPDETADRIRDHIGECAECRTRLEEAETVRTRATQLLGIATPHADVPPFEAVLQRAPEAARGSRFRIPGPARLAWAASIVLALGIGWFGRDLAPFRAVSQREEPALSSAPAEGRAAGTAETAAPPSAPPQPEMARAAEPAAPTRDALGAAAGEVSTAGRRDARQRVQAEADQAKPLTDQVAAQRVAAEQAQRARGADLSRSAEAMAGKVAAPPPPVTVQPTAALGQKTAVTGAAAAIAWEFVTEEEAERRAGRPVMTIPGLEVVNVGVALSGSSLLVRTTQRLADQNLIELVQEPVSIAGAAENRREAARAAAPAEPGFTTDATGAVILKLQRGNVMLTGRATLPVDSLRTLMQRAAN